MNAKKHVLWLTAAVLALVCAAWLAPRAPWSRAAAATHDHGSHEKAPVPDAEHDGHAAHAEAEPAHEDEHGEEDGHDGHDHEHEERVVTLSEDQRAALKLRMAVATAGPLAFDLRLPAEVRVNEDRLAHVTPRLSGIVTEVRHSVGDHVSKGEVLAVLDSRELADTAAGYLAARSRLALAEKTHDREKRLYEKKISAEKDYLEASRALEEARIEVRTAQQKLRALGVEQLPDEERSLTRHEVRAPFDGEILEKHIVLGEFLNGESNAFLIADLSTVWVDMSVYQEDLPRVGKGQAARLSAGNGLPPTEGIISYVAPIVDRETRTALARMLVPNPEGTWRPGLFLDAHLAFESKGQTVVAPKTAVQRLREEPVVFVEAPDGFKAVPVTLGHENGDFVQVVSGLAPGQHYVVEGAFELKAKLVTSGMGSHAGHGH